MSCSSCLWIIWGKSIGRAKYPCPPCKGLSSIPNYWLWPLRTVLWTLSLTFWPCSALSEVEFRTSYDHCPLELEPPKCRAGVEFNILPSKRDYQALLALLGGYCWICWLISSLISGLFSKMIQALKQPCVEINPLPANYFWIELVLGMLAYTPKRRADLVMHHISITQALFGRGIGGW